MQKLPNNKTTLLQKDYILPNSQATVKLKSILQPTMIKIWRFYRDYMLFLLKTYTFPSYLLAELKSS